MNPREEQVLQLIADPQNRAILTVLNDAAHPLAVSELADRLERTDAWGCDGAATDPDREEIHISLHHTKLPKLEAAGLLEYDRSANVVSDGCAPAVDAEVLELELIDELVSHFGPGRDVVDDGIGAIEGRDAVIDYGHRLTDAAEDELFLMYVSEDLLQPACLDRVEAALERGVDVTLGSTNPDVLELVRDRLPEVTVWEPQLDWWNEPSTYPTVGRLVFADRERIMLAILKESDVDGTTTEMAITGDGPENPLVVLVRELLGPRLDHLDYQSEEFLDELPFES